MIRPILILLALGGCAGVAGMPSNEWNAGAASVSITPLKYGWMTGYGSRNKPAEGVKQDLKVRVLALEDRDGSRALLVSAEILGFPPDLSRSIKKRLRAELRIPEERVLLSATHTHAGPAIPQRPAMEIFHGLDEQSGASIFEYAAWFSDRVLEAGAAALKALRPARLEYALATESFGMNRRFRNENGSYSIKDNPSGLKDPAVSLLRVQSEEGALLSLVFTYACHCTTLGGNVYEYHGDWSGVACAEIERAQPGCVALFATGCGADLNPSPRGTFDLAAQHGQSMARTALGLHPGRRISGPLKAVIDQVRLPLEQPPSPDLLDKVGESKDVYRKRFSREMLKLSAAGRLPAHVDLPVQVWHFGESLTLVALGGETCVGYALRLKKELGPERTWVLGYANEVPCYIPTEQVLAESGYESGWDAAHGKAVASGSMMYYGWPAPFAPGIEERLIGAALRLAK